MTVDQCCFQADSVDWRGSKIVMRKAACKNLSTAVIPVVCSMAQNKVTGNNDIVSLLDSAVQNLSEVECYDGGDEIGDN